MKRILLRSAFILGALLVCGAAVLTGYFRVLKPERARPAQIRVEATPARLARGQYLYTLGDCDGCHSPRDFSRFAGPAVPGRRGSGVVLPRELKLPGVVVAPNITPDRETGIGGWTDGEKIRAIREGVSRDGHPLFPMMPYGFLRNMSDEDAYSLVAFLNALPPVKNALPRTRLDFPVSVLIRTAPRPAGNVAEPDRKDRVAYGRYLTMLGGCVDCHTPDNGKGAPLPGMLLAGGRAFSFPTATVVSANITPDAQTGIGRWTEQDFVDRFYQYREYVEHGSPAVGPEGFTLMPWLNLAQLPEEDLKAIYAFLRTQNAVANAVETHPGVEVSRR